MQKRKVQILLIVSLAFNLAFIGFGTFKYFKIRRFSDPRLRFRHAPQEIRDNFRQHREIIDPIRDEIEIIRGEFFEELKKPVFDEDSLRKKLDQYLERQAQLERIMGNNFIEIRKNLTAEQAEEFLSHFPKMKPPPFERRKPPQSFKGKHE